MSSGATGMYYSFRDTFMIKMCHFLAEMKIVHYGRSAISGFQRIVSVINFHTMTSGKVGTFASLFPGFQLVCFVSFLLFIFFFHSVGFSMCDVVIEYFIYATAPIFMQ